MLVEIWLVSVEEVVVVVVVIVVVMVVVRVVENWNIQNFVPPPLHVDGAPCQ